METHKRVSSGHKGFDEMIDQLRLGDNVVWQVDTIADYQEVVNPYVQQTLKDKRNLVYVRFGSHEPLLEENPDIQLYHLDPDVGFERFAAEIHRLMEKEGRKTFYVFDCLTDLLQHWNSDLMIGNFFKVTCPYLFDLDTIAYFAIRRNMHPNSCIAGIRKTTQLLLDIYRLEENLYIHPIKVWERYSPTMFFPHLIRGDKAISITSSAEAAELFSGITRSQERLDYWHVMFDQAKNAVQRDVQEQQPVKRKLMEMLIGQKSRMLDLCDRYFSLQDLLAIASRVAGSGYIGGKTVGMLLARKILMQDSPDRFGNYLEAHDSYYLGSDLFYTYVVQNGWWKLRARQKTREGYFSLAPELKECLLSGRFPSDIRQEFVRILEYFGQSPIIVRSSSLLEDNFGNAFAGKYDSIFCANQGSMDERLEDFEQAVRTVYASTMSEDALEYRMNRGLFEKDEQMAILVQRVSGDHHQDLFFPHLAGVGNSSNLYVWDQRIDMEAGMLRLVFGLGTRAVDRTVNDYARIVTLDKPFRLPLADPADKRKFSQRHVDLIHLSENRFATLTWEEVSRRDFKVNKNLFASPDEQAERLLREKGHEDREIPYILDFQTVLGTTRLAGIMKDMLAVLSGVYKYPVDIEFTVNFSSPEEFKINLVQCRPLQTRGLGKPVRIPDPGDARHCLFASSGHFMGGNVHLPVEQVIYIRPDTYQQLKEEDKYTTARLIGKINRALEGKPTMIMGPGRWGTSTPSLGVPVHFSEISRASVICEISSPEEGFMPELSYGSHFFQDLVETGIFYIALFRGRKEVTFRPELLLGEKNGLQDLVPGSDKFLDVVHVVRIPGLQVYSDIVSQKVLCCRDIVQAGGSGSTEQ